MARIVHELLTKVHISYSQTISNFRDTYLYQSASMLTLIRSVPRLLSCREFIVSDENARSTRTFLSFLFRVSVRVSGRGLYSSHSLARGKNICQNKSQMCIPKVPIMNIRARKWSQTPSPARAPMRTSDGSCNGKSIVRNNSQHVSWTHMAFSDNVFKFKSYIKSSCLKLLHS